MLGALADHARHLAGLGTELGREGRALLRERRAHRPAPPDAGLVVDVGGGDRPDPRADLVVDKYVVDDFERGGDLTFARPVVVADGEALPFADRSFDYLVAAHVLEHAIDPVRMAGEFARVAPRGFVQVPSADAERVYGWPFHPWLVTRRGQTLVFRPKEHDAPTAGRVMHDVYDESLLVRLGWAAHRSRWHHSLQWSGRIDVDVEGERVFHEQAALDLDRTLSALRELGAAGRVVSLDERLRALLRDPDPACRGVVVLKGDAAVCRECGTRYPAPGGVPVLLAEAAVSAVR